MPASPLQKLVKLDALSNMLNNPNHSLARAQILTDPGVPVLHTISIRSLFFYEVFPLHTVPALTSIDVQSLIEKAALLIRICGRPPGYVIQKGKKKSIILRRYIYLVLLWSFLLAMLIINSSLLSVADLLQKNALLYGATDYGPTY